MMRTGLVGLLFALAALIVGFSGSALLHRWCVRRVPFFARHRRATFAAMGFLVVLAPAGRFLVNLGLDDRFFWLEAVGQLWGMSLLVSVPAIYGWEFAVALYRSRKPTPLGLGVGPESPSRREALVGGAFVGVSIAPLLWGVRTRFDVEVVEVPIRLSRLPKVLDGFSIVQVSDIHIGAYLGERQLRDVADRVAALKPDLVVMTGDLVHLRAAYLPLGMDWLRRLGGYAKYGQVSILGNHEYYTGRPAVLEAFERAKLDLLVNQSKRIQDGLVILGVDDMWSSSKGLGPKLRPTLHGVPPDDAMVLLCHQPQFHTIAAAWDLELQLSGHTHGGQIAPYGPLVARAMFGPHRGLYRVGPSSLYVNRGLGTSGPPSRVAVRPEITKIILVAG